MKKPARAGVKIGVSYGRYSDEKQNIGKDGLSKPDGTLVAQRTRCEQYAHQKSQHTGIRHEFAEHLTDHGLSGGNTKRPGYQRLWKLIEREEIDFLVAAELSRLNRNNLDFAALVDHCEKHKVSLFIVGLDLDTSSPIGRVIVNILASLAQFEREMVAMRVRENCQARLQSCGKINGASTILGLDSDPNHRGHFIANPQKLKDVERLLRLYLVSGSKQKVLAEAKRVGIKGKDGQELTSYMLDQVLFNVRWRYRGLWFANRENEGSDDLSLPDSKKFQIVQLPHGPLIHDVNLLDQVQRMLDHPARKHRRSGSNDYTYVLSHVLFHETGGARFTGESARGGKHRYYFNRELKRRIHCHDLDARVLETLKAHLLDNETFQTLVLKALKRDGKSPSDLKATTFDLLESIHKLPGSAQRTIIETLVKRITVGEEGTLTIELYGESSTVVGRVKKPSVRKRTIAPTDGLPVGGEGESHG